MFSGIASCSRISSSSTTARKRKPSAAGDQDPADVLVVGAGRQLDPARRGAAREAVDDELGARARRSWRLLRFRSGRRPGPGRPRCRPSAASTKASYSSGETTRPRSASPRRPGPERVADSPSKVPSSSALKTIWFVLPGTASRLPARSGTYQVWTTSVEMRSSDDRGVDRDHQLVVGEGAVRVVVAPQPLLAGRLDRQRLGAWRPARPAAPVAGVSRALSVKTMPRTKSTAAKTVEHARRPGTGARGRRGPGAARRPRSAR